MSYLRFISYFRTFLKTSVRVRFAPSPTGNLHLGGLRTALFNFLFARKHGGKFLLRIEDTDQKRTQSGALQNILDTLRWARLIPDEGPGFGGSHGPYIQSERRALYAKTVQRLLREEKAYRCFCSSDRLEMLARSQRRRGETPGYDRKCRQLSAREMEAKMRNQEDFVVRFKLEEGAREAEDMIIGSLKNDVGRTEGDPVLLKADGLPVYHLASVVDDHLMEISHVIRGIEWLPSLHKHLAIYDALGWSPPRFAHVPLLLNEEKLKVSKRSPEHHKFEVDGYTTAGYLPESVLNWLLRSGGGFSHERPWRAGMSMEEMITDFDVSKLLNTGSQLNWPSLENCGEAHFSQRMTTSTGRQDILKELRLRFPNMMHYSDEENKRIFETVLQGRISHYSDFDLYNFLWEPPVSSSVLTSCRKLANDDEIRNVLSLLQQRLQAQCDIDSLLRDTGVKKSVSMRLVRLCLVGMTDGPRVSDLLSSLPIDEARRRMQIIIETMYAPDNQRMS